MLDNAKYCVYAIRCKINGRLYIGCTSDLQTRIGNHFSELRNRKKIKQSNVNKKETGVEWQTDYDKYGEGAFEFYVLEDNISKTERLTREAYWIKKYDSTNPAKGYNYDCRFNKITFKISSGLPPMPSGVTVDELLTDHDTDEEAAADGTDIYF